MSIELLKLISTQKAHKTCYKQGSILHYLGTNQFLVAPLSLQLGPIDKSSPVGEKSQVLSTS